MRSLPFIIILSLLIANLSAQNPHGEELKMDCSACHTSESWDIPADAWHFEKDSKIELSRTTNLPLNADNKFNHYKTDFPLEGQHTGVDCRACHASLIFNEANAECISCHVDIHRQTVGADCARCHTSDNWLVNNITEIHQENGFPLLGVHAQISCTECHQSESDLEFNRIGNECINCHLEDYNATTEPNHTASGFSLECIDCHKIEGFDWSSEFINHDFFPLVKGHDIADCNACHIDGNFTNTPTECIACHQADFENAQNPKHNSSYFSTNCMECHTLDLDWMPAEFLSHDNLFPIYSGSHKGEWDACIDCHLNPDDFSQFTCTTCHERNETANQHDEVNGYVYESNACLVCHPTGNEEDRFDHDRTQFPLKGAHASVDCKECHTNGYAGTPTNCEACHLEDFNTAKDPDHLAGNFSKECQVCHTEVAWKPATFDHNLTDFPLRGTHTTVDCIECHADGYAGTPTNCEACHLEDFNSAKEPDHVASGFSKECQICHSESAWEPATFDHNQTNFPLQGAHATVDCIECHADGYAGTPTNCEACHIEDYNQTTNPNHRQSGFSTECQACHTETTWIPATFDHDLTDFSLQGAHATVDCIECHADGYMGTPTNCEACHINDYNQTRNPNHRDAGFPIECEACHNETAWEPATFDHDAMYFPIYSGKHRGEWQTCNECHINNNYSSFSCIDCHEHNDPNELANDHEDVSNYRYESNACYQCHPDGRE